MPTSGQDCEVMRNMYLIPMPPDSARIQRNGQRPGMIILTARMCSGAAREGDSIRRQIRCDCFNPRRPRRIRQT
ncbi:hypothetical protein KQR56_13655 [Bacillus velezensis]|nr:hypothetical protein [Bacillus velezensis]